MQNLVGRQIQKIIIEFSKSSLSNRIPKSNKLLHKITFFKNSSVTSQHAVIHHQMHIQFQTRKEWIKSNPQCNIQRKLRLYTPIGIMFLTDWTGWSGLQKWTPLMTFTSSQGSKTWPITRCREYLSKSLISICKKKETVDSIMSFISFVQNLLRRINVLVNSPNHRFVLPTKKSNVIR